MLLDVSNISVKYEESMGDVIQDVSLEVENGEVVSILGPNGAGKSTLLRSIAGVLNPTEGTITFDGADITGDRPKEVLDRGICLVPEERELFPHMSVEDNLNVAAQNSGITDYTEIYETFPVLGERLQQTGSSLSGGEQQMLAIAQGLLTEPKLLLLDEPSLGLAPQIIDDVFEVIEGLVEQGVTILLVEQQAKRALQSSDRTYILREGRIRHQGPSEELLEGDKLSEAYLK